MIKSLEEKENAQLENLRNQLLRRKHYLKRGERTQESLRNKEKEGTQKQISIMDNNLRENKMAIVDI